MEHRCSSRKPLMLDVVIGYNAIGLVQGRTRDVGLGGMFVETGCVELPVNAVVQASFILEKNGRKAACQAKALVVHNQSLGAGLMFNDLNDDLYSTLHDILSTRACEDEAGAAPNPTVNLNAKTQE